MTPREYEQQIQGGNNDLQNVQSKAFSDDREASREHAMNKILHTSTKYTIHKEQDPTAMLSESQNAPHLVKQITKTFTFPTTVSLGSWQGPLQPSNEASNYYLPL